MSGDSLTISTPQSANVSYPETEASFSSAETTSQSSSASSSVDIYAQDMSFPEAADQSYSSFNAGRSGARYFQEKPVLSRQITSQIGEGDGVSIAYPLAANFDALPPALQETMASFRSDPQIRFSFREVVVAEGVKIPEFSFYRVIEGADASGPSSGGRSLPSANQLSPVSLKTKLGYLAGATAYYVVFDQFVIEKLVAEKILPPSLRDVASFTGLVASGLAAEKLGLLPTGSVVSSFSHIGALTGFQLIALYALDKTGVRSYLNEKFHENGERLTKVGGVVLGGLGYAVTAHTAETLALRAASQGAAAGLSAAGVGAAALTWGLRIVSGAGYVTLVNFGASLMHSGMEKVTGLDQSPAYRLRSVSKAITTNEELGFFSGVVGFLYETAREVEDRIEPGSYEKDLEATSDSLVTETRQFEKVVEKKVLEFVSNRKIRNLETGKMVTDWTAVRQDIKNWYTNSADRDLVRGHYDQWEKYTSGGGVGGLLMMITVDGDVKNLQELQTSLATSYGEEIENHVLNLVNYHKTIASDGTVVIDWVRVQEGLTAFYHQNADMVRAHYQGWSPYTNGKAHAPYGSLSIDAMGKIMDIEALRSELLGHVESRKEQLSSYDDLRQTLSGKVS